MKTNILIMIRKLMSMVKKSEFIRGN